MKCCRAGEGAIIFYFAEEASPSVLDTVRNADYLIRQQEYPWLIDTIPSYASLLVQFDPLSVCVKALKNTLCPLLNDAGKRKGSAGSRITLPVYYGQEWGGDLVNLAQRVGLCANEVIAIHQQQEYLVYSIGFAPGFAYMGQVDERIAAPRLTSPRKCVPKGAVAIADRQTAVYPHVSPGGWNLIGLCPVDMFDPVQSPCMPVSVGDRVKFEAIDKQAFLDAGGIIPEQLT